MEFLELKRYDDLDYSLIYRVGANISPFVCAWNPTYNNDGTISHWSQGHYFEELDSAINYLNNLKKKHLSEYEQYKLLNAEDINNLRKYSCFNAAFETSPFLNDDEIERIGLFAYNKWIECISEVSPEDIAILTTMTLKNNENISIDDIKDLINDDLFIDYDGDLSSLQEILEESVRNNTMELTNNDPVK